MIDLPVRRLMGTYYTQWWQDRGAHRCCICGCIPKAQWTHKVADEVTARLGYEYMTTCAAHYCRAQDEARR